MDESMSVRKENQKRFPWVLVIFLALTFGCLGFLNRGVSSAGRISCYLLIGWALLLPTDDLLCLIAVALPSGQIYKFDGSYTAMPFLLLIYIIKTFINNGTKIENDTVKPLLWTIVLFIVSVIASIVHSISIIKIIPFFVHLVFVTVTLRINHVNEEKIYNKLALYFVTGTMLVCFGTILFPSVSKTLSNISVYSRANPGFSSTWDFGRSLSISIAFILVSYLKTKKRLIIDLVLILIMLYFVIQCGRFSMLLGLGALLICVPFANGTDKPRRQRIMYSVIMMFIMALLSYIIFRYVYSSMVELRGYGASDNGRLGVWRTYFKYLSNNPVIVAFGTGGGSIGSVASTLGISTAHNILLEKVIEVGIFGLIIFILYFIALYRGKTLKNINVLPLITFLGTAMTQGTTGNVAFALLLAMCVADKCDENPGNMEAQNEYPVRN